MKKCPFCAEAIQDGAIFCTHCGRDLVNQTGQVIVVARGTATPEKVQAARDAGSALTMAIVGIFIFGIFLEPGAIIIARRAKKILAPGDAGYDSANAAEIIGWVVLILTVILMCIGFGA